MRRFIRSIESIVAENMFFTVLLLSGAFLRTFRLQEFTIFLSDQGRDALIVKDIVTLQHFPLIGAPTSIGQVFLGPAYYYLVAPFLLLFNFNPVGLVYGVVFYSLVGIVWSYAVIKREMGVQVALIFSFLVLFSSVQTELSRFSWNPNLLPFTAFFALHYLYKLFEQPTVKYGVLFGFFMGLSVQFHYLALLLLPAIGLWYLIRILNLKFKILIFFKQFFIVPFLSFILTISPLILFDLRHGFLNVTNFLKLFTEQKNVPHELLSTRFLNVNNAFYNLFFHVDISVSMAVLVSIVISILYLVTCYQKKVSLFIHLNAFAVFLFFIFFSFLQTPRHIHYYTPIYLSFSVVVAYLLSLLLDLKRKGVIVLMLMLAVFTWLNLRNLPFFAPAGNGQINHAKRVADFMIPKIGNQPYNIATWPIYFTEDNYIYFLSLAGHPPADRKKLEITDQLFVLCNEEPCLVIDSPSWNISMFGKAKVDTMWQVEGIKIYRLVR